jgi:hypothetical protein
MGDRREAHQFREVECLTRKRDAAGDEIDHGGDRERESEQ